MSVVLIVDDVPGMRDQYAYDIKRLSEHDTITASGGAEALQMIDREPVDCVILDLELQPGNIDGFEVLKTLQSRGSDVPEVNVGSDVTALRHASRMAPRRCAR